MDRLDFPPVRSEIADQLKRILSSPRFRNAPNPSAFLKLTVQRALNGKKTTGNMIAKSLFGEKFISGESVDVRVTARNLRKALERYYENEGNSDVVIISYPEPSIDKTVKPVEGEAYTPRFRHNPKHEPSIQTRVAYRHLERRTYRDYHRALAIFTTILDRDIDNVGALLGLVETFCKFADYGWAPPVEAASDTICANVLTKLEDIYNGYWRYWAARAHFCTRTDAKESAATCYEKALSLDRLATESYVPFIEYLATNGKRDVALGLAQRYFNEHVEDSVAIAQSGEIFFLAGALELGIEQLNAALELDPANCAALQTLATIYFIRRDKDEFAKHVRKLKVLLDAESLDLFLHHLERYEDQVGLSGLIKQTLAELS